MKKKTWVVTFPTYTLPRKSVCFYNISSLKTLKAARIISWKSGRMPKSSPISPRASWNCQWMTPVCKTLIFLNVGCFAAPHPLFGVAIRWPRSSIVFPEHSIISLLCVSFESGLCFYLLDLWVEFLEKSSCEGVCSVHSLTRALEVHTNKVLGTRIEPTILSLSCVTTTETSPVIHN